MEFCALCRRLVLVVVLLVAVVSSASVQVSKRAVSAESLSSSSNMAGGSGTKFCHSRTPCGWAVYTPFTRTVDYFMKNTCVCPKGKICLRTDDDLSVSAYVYRCRVEVSPNEADTEPPT